MGTEIKGPSGQPVATQPTTTGKATPGKVSSKMDGLNIATTQGGFGANKNKLDIGNFSLPDIPNTNIEDAESGANAASAVVTKDDDGTLKLDLSPDNLVRVFFQQF